MHCNRLQAAVVVAVLALTSCSQSPKTGEAKTEAAAGAAVPSGPVTGKTAFWEMYKSAHAWAKDMVPLALETKKLPGAKIENGNALVWTATFGSLSLKQARTFTYAVSNQPPDIAKGVTVGNGLPWGGPTTEALPFQSDDFVVDSDAAYKTAAEKATAWLKKNPDKEVSFALGNAARFKGPVWYVLWGDKKSGYAVFVDAKSGTVVNHK